MAIEKPQLNPLPIGPAHIYWPDGSPVRRIPFDGVYAIGYEPPKFLKGRPR